MRSKAALFILTAFISMIAAERASAQSGNSVADCKISDCARQMVEIANKLMHENEELKRRLLVVEAALKVEHGLITAFESLSCPEGWLPYEKVRGRFILGLTNVDKEGPAGTLASVVVPGKVGGSESQKLTLKNLPAHSHLTDLGTLNNEGYYGQGEQYGGTLYGARRGPAFLSKTSVVGEASPDPVSTVPSYVGLLFCQKQ